MLSRQGLIFPSQLQNVIPEGIETIFLERMDRYFFLKKGKLGHKDHLLKDL